MGRRKLLKPEERDERFGIPDDENSLILHYTLADLLEVELRHRNHSKLGFALQLISRCGASWPKPARR